MARIPAIVVLVLCAACQAEEAGEPAPASSAGAGAFTGGTSGGESPVGGAPAGGGGYSTQGGSSGAGGTFEAGGTRPEGAGGSGGGARLTVDQAREQYTGWHRFTEEPVAVSSQFLASCTMPAVEQEFLVSVHGYELYLLNWLNAAANEARSHKETAPFPPGAAIVKEKLRRAVGGGMSVFALGIMIKREAGFDPEHGDWEYAYWKTGGSTMGGREAAKYCGGCHASSPTDFVFLDQRWRLPPQE